MGHQRLGKLPRSKPWRDVVELIAGGADITTIAAATSQAAEKSMIDASQDAAVRHAFWLLAKIPLAAKEEDFVHRLRALGLNVSDRPTLADIVSEMTDAVDRAVWRERKASDYGEIAQICAAETLYAIASRVQDFLLDAADLAKTALKTLATERNFSVLARDYFARLTRRHLDYYLSRELSSHVGPGRRFLSVREHRAFEDALDLHCRETSRVIKEYAGEWLSKHEFEGGIDPAIAGRFVSHASEKIRSELRQRRNADAAA